MEREGAARGWHGPGGSTGQGAEGTAGETDPSGAWEAAVALLAMRARSSEELRRRLRQRRFSREEIEAAIARLTAAGYLNDAAFALQWALARQARQGLGPARLARELKAKGVGDGEVAAALESLRGERDERQVAAEAAAQRMKGLRGLPAEAARRRLAASLERRGFSVEVILDLCRQHFPSVADTD
ncbi:MAG: regulatory protein RecX [candidate division NC10 bacterium]|nr:regulatory protein RecX [candidate division NC10 bacterium]